MSENQEMALPSGIAAFEAKQFRRPSGGWDTGRHPRVSHYTQLVGLGKPAYLQACLAGP